MPELVAAAVTAAEAVTAFLGTTIPGTVFTVGNALTAVLTVGSAMDSRRQARNTAADARRGYLESLESRSVMIRSAVAPRTVTYGRDLVSGPLVDAFTTGDKGQYLHLIVAICAREIDAFEAVYFNDKPLPMWDSDGFVRSGDYSRTTTNTALYTASPTAGVITLPRAASKILGISYALPDFAGDVSVGWSHTPGSASITGLTDPGVPLNINYEWTEATPRVRIHAFTGAAGQTVPSDLITESAGRRSADHAGAGIAWLWVRLEWDSQVFGQIGMPNVSALIRGVKVRDPRTGTTAWSDNAALCAADYARDQTLGLRCTADQVPDADVIVAANICDETVVLNLAGDTQTRYTANGTLSAGDGRLDNFDALCDAMAGGAIWTQGRWLIRAGAHPTPEPWTLTADHLGEAAPELQRGLARRDLVNAVSVQYRDPAQNYATVAAPPVVNSGYQTADGGRRISRTIKLALVQDSLRAQRLGKITLERARQATTLQVETSMRGYNLLPGQVIPVGLSRYGWSGKQFEVRRREFDFSRGTIKYLLRETAAGVWAWNYGEATVGDMSPDTDLPNPLTPPPALTGLAVASGTAHLKRQSDGTITTRGYVSWNIATDGFVVQGGTIELQYKLDADATWQTAGSVPGDSTNTYIGPLVDGTVTLVRARAVNAVGRYGAWATVAHEVVGKTQPPSDVTNFASSVANAVGSIGWDACPDADYGYTEVRSTDANWGSSTVLPAFAGKANGWRVVYTALGTYQWYARHVDQSGNVSVNSAHVTQVVTSLGGGSTTPTFGMTAIPSVHIVQLDPNGVVQSWAGAKSTITVLDSTGADVTGSWTYTIDTAQSTLTGTISSNVVSIDGWDSTLVDSLWPLVKFFLPFDGSYSEVRMGYATTQTGTIGFTYPTLGNDVWLEVGGLNASSSNEQGVQVGYGSGQDAISDLDLETGDLCIEGEWLLYHPSIGRPRQLVSVMQYDGQSLYTIGEESGYFYVKFPEPQSGGAICKTISYTGVTVAANTRYHVALTRVGNVYSFYINGVRQSSPGPYTTTFRQAAGPRYISVGNLWFGLSSPSQYLDALYGKINYVRATAGTGASRYSGSSFTPPANQPPRGYLPGASMRLVGSQSGYTDLEAYVSVFPQTTTLPAQTPPGISGYASPTLITLLCRQNGAPITSVTTGATTTADAAITISIKRGGVEQAPLWTFTPIFSTGLGGYYAGLSSTTGQPYVRLNYIGDTQDFGTVKIKCTRTGYTDIDLVVDVNKQKTMPNVGAQVWDQTNAFYSAQAVNVSGGSTASLVFGSDGNVTRVENGISRTTQQVPWFTPVASGTGSGYQIRFTVLSGDTPSTPSMATWISLASDVTVTLPYSGGPKACLLQVDIRPGPFTPIVGGGQSALIAD